MQINREKSYKISLSLNVILALIVVVLVLNKVGILTRQSFQQTEYSYRTNNHYDLRVTSFELNNRDTDVVFAGDSITEYGPFDEFFPDTKLINRGISGDITAGLNARMGEILSHHPQKIFIMIGINDLSHNIPLENSMNNYKSIIEKIKTAAPNCEIYVESVLPAVTIDLNKVDQFNEYLKDLCAQENVNFIDLYDLYLEEGKINKVLFADTCHLNGYGFQKLIVAIQEKVYK